MKSVELAPGFVLGKSVEQADGSVEIPVEMTEDLKQAISILKDRVEAKVAHLEGVKQGAVMYLLQAMGKQINKRQMKRVKRILQTDILPGVVTREIYFYEHNGAVQKLGEFDTLTPVSGKFELRFKSGFMLTEKQEQDVTAILNYEHA